MEKIELFLSKMNQKQKIAFASIFSVGIFIVSFGYARSIIGHPLNHLDRTWFPFLLAIVIIGFIWYKVLEDKEH